MDFRLIEMASKQSDDVLFNLFSLKMKYLVRHQTCESCKQSVQEWFFIRVCHNTLCKKCLDQIKHRSIILCPVCNTTFDLKQDIVTSENMKTSFNQIEELIFSLLSLEKETSEVLYHGDSNLDLRVTNLTKPGIIHIKSVKLDSDVEEQSKIEKNMKVTEHIQHFETTTFDKLQFNNVTRNNSTEESSQNYNIDDKLQCSNKDCSSSNVKDNIVEKTPLSILQINNFKTTEHKQDLETISLDGIKFNNVTIDFSKNNSQDYGMSDEQSYDYSSSGSGSDDNMVYGTPPNRSLLVSDPKNLYNRKDICITYSNFNAKELNVITQFYKMFKVRVNVDWSDEVTHLVIKLNFDGTYARTRKCINAILSHCSIVTDEWVLKSLRERSIQPEQEYMPLDECGEASVLRSWRIGRGIINSSMLWAVHCTLYFHTSVVTHEYFTAFKGWALKVGFTVIEHIEEFNSSKSDFRIILTDFRIPEKEINSAANSELMNWLKTFKAITVHLDWYLDVLCKYRRVLIEPHYQVLKLNFSMVELAGINESVISIEENN